MKTTKIMGIVLLVLAGIAGYMGFTESQGLGSSLSSAFDGKPSDDVLIKYGATVVLAFMGVTLLKK